MTFIVISSMNNAPKIHLSTLERELMQNKEWILTKRSAIQKVYELFGDMHNVYKGICISSQFSIPGFADNNAVKISKGENYEGLPYVMMDYPASFSRENIFAIRTMFWWGNFFSVSLHLSREKFRLSGDFGRPLSYLKEKDFFICIHENQWQHNFEASNYSSVSSLDNKKIYEILEKDFFKISKKIELNEWDNVPGFLEKTFKEIIEFVKISFPGDEKDPLPEFPKDGSDL